MEEKLINKVEEKINNILEKDIDTNNLEHLYKLTKIRHIAKEENNMYGNYGRYGDNYGRNYGEYGNYGRRGYDTKYRGYGHLDNVYQEYGRYMDSRERYGASEETDKSYHYMIKALEDFIKVLEEEADNPQQKQQLREALQNAMR